MWMHNQCRVWNCYLITSSYYGVVSRAWPCVQGHTNLNLDATNSNECVHLDGRQKRKMIFGECLPKKYDSCRVSSFRFVYCESFSGFGIESGAVSKWHKARFCKDNVTRKQFRHNVSRVVFKMASKYECDLNFLVCVELWAFWKRMTPTKSFLTLKFRLAKKAKATQSLKTKPGQNICGS